MNNPRLDSRWFGTRAVLQGVLGGMMGDDVASFNKQTKKKLGKMNHECRRSRLDSKQKQSPEEALDVMREMIQK